MAVRAATGNRISFELCYGEALRDSNSRMWFFANASALALRLAAAFSAAPVRPGVRPLRAINDEIIESPTFYADELCVEDVYRARRWFHERAVANGNCIANHTRLEA